MRARVCQRGSYKNDRVSAVNSEGLRQARTVAIFPARRLSAPEGGGHRQATWQAQPCLGRFILNSAL
jgi:hypothetical protein